jgi:hypothetical protein
MFLSLEVIRYHAIRRDRINYSWGGIKGLFAGTKAGALQRAGTSLRPVDHVVQGFAPRHDSFIKLFTIIPLFSMGNRLKLIGRTQEYDTCTIRWASVCPCQISSIRACGSRHKLVSVNLCIIILESFIGITD